MASSPSLYLTLFASDEYRDAVVNTMLYVGIGVNTSLFLALLLSGFFMRRSRWVKALLVVSMLPWALPAQTGFISFNGMLVYWGFLKSVLEKLFGIFGADWLSHYWLALGANVVASTWKTMPFWTLFCWRGGWRSSGSTKLPISTGPPASAASSISWCHCWRTSTARLLSVIWMIGDFNTVDLVSGGAPWFDGRAGDQRRIPV
jgi:multiple sugar transport system permease protein